jgi:hypothetical protein
MQVRLSTAAPTVAGANWYCQIKLRREYSKDNKQLDSAPKEQAFAALNQDRKEHLHHYITAAQRALLNPDTPHDTFVRIADLAVAKEEADSKLQAAAGGGNGAAGSSNGSGSKAAGTATAAATDELQFTRNVVVLEITGVVTKLAFYWHATTLKINELKIVSLHKNIILCACCEIVSRTSRDIMSCCYVISFGC